MGRRPGGIYRTWQEAARWLGVIVVLLGVIWGLVIYLLFTVD